MYAFKYSVKYFLQVKFRGPFLTERYIFYPKQFKGSSSVEISVNLAHLGALDFLSYFYSESSAGLKSNWCHQPNVEHFQKIVES